MTTLSTLFMVHVVCLVSTQFKNKKSTELWSTNESSYSVFLRLFNFLAFLLSAVKSQDFDKLRSFSAQTSPVTFWNNSSDIQQRSWGWMFFRKMARGCVCALGGVPDRLPKGRPLDKWLCLINTSRNRA